MIQSQAHAAASAPLTTFHKRSTLGGTRDAFAVLHVTIFYLQIMLLQNWSRGKAPLEGLGTKSLESEAF